MSDSFLHSTSSDSSLIKVVSEAQISRKREAPFLKKEAIDSRAPTLSRVRPKSEKKRQSRQEDRTAVTAVDGSYELGSLSGTSTDSIHPLTILQKGNSDPFSSYAIPIKAETNETLLFYESNVLPLLVAYMEANGVSASAGKASWHDPFSSLHDKCAAYGLLARTAVVMSRSAAPGSRLVVNSLVYKKKTSELLRARLMKGEQSLFVSQICPIGESHLRRNHACGNS